MLRLIRPLARRVLHAQIPSVRTRALCAFRPASTLSGNGSEHPVPQGLGAKSRISAKASLDPAGVYTPSEFVDLQLKSPEVQQFIETLSPEDFDTYSALSTRLFQENGHSDLLALNDIGEFFEQRGVDLDLPDALFEPTGKHVHFDDTQPQMFEISTLNQKTNKTQTFRSLIDPIPALDARDVQKFPPSKFNPYGAQVTIRNHIPVFDTPSSGSGSSSPTQPQLYNLPIKVVSSFYQSILIKRNTFHQSSKGKMRGYFYLVLMGNGNGLVGYGQGANPNPRIALQKAKTAAVKNMDSVARFEDRTVYTEMSAKLGATHLIIRPRPVGFGLRCNPYLHQILRAAGFKDISAKVWGSRNRLNVIKCAFMMIQGGYAPVGMGDGVGGKGRKLSRGVGMMGQTELERARGRKLISLRK